MSACGRLCYFIVNTCAYSFFLELNTRQKIHVNLPSFTDFTLCKRDGKQEQSRHCSNNYKIIPNDGKLDKPTHEMCHLFLINNNIAPRCCHPCVMANSWNDWDWPGAPTNDENNSWYTDGNWWSDGWRSDGWQSGDWQSKNWDDNWKWHKQSKDWQPSEWQESDWKSEQSWQHYDHRSWSSDPWKNDDTEQMVNVYVEPLHPMEFAGLEIPEGYQPHVPGLVQHVKPKPKVAAPPKTPPPARLLAKAKGSVAKVTVAKTQSKAAVAKAEGLPLSPTKRRPSVEAVSAKTKSPKHVMPPKKASGMKPLALESTDGPLPKSSHGWKASDSSTSVRGGSSGRTDPTAEEVFATGAAAVAGGIFIPASLLGCVAKPNPAGQP